VHPKLSGFCTELTGITQDKVDNGVILEEALKKVEAFLKEKNLLTSKHVFVTCGDWDLSICLKQEALAKKITVPDYLKSYINIKKLFPTDDTYRKKYKKTLPGMAKMLELAKLELLGRHHSGIDDSINIARVGIWMMQHGVNFSVRNVSNPKY
jgi:inhibitor of KinA sporulation pathway (predicted exonuclease)